MRPRFAPLALLLACLAPATARASFGTEFWLAAPESQAAAGQPMSVVVSNANDVPVDVSLEDLMTKKVLWKENGIEAVFISDYKVTIGDITATKIAKEDAIKKASQDIAWTLRSRVLEGF